MVKEFNLQLTMPQTNSGFLLKLCFWHFELCKLILLQESILQWSSGLLYIEKQNVDSKKTTKVCPWSSRTQNKSCFVDHISTYVHPNNAEFITYDSHFTKYEGRLALIISKKYQEWFPQHTVLLGFNAQWTAELWGCWKTIHTGTELCKKLLFQTPLQRLACQLFSVMLVHYQLCIHWL